MTAQETGCEVCDLMLEYGFELEVTESYHSGEIEYNEFSKAERLLLNRIFEELDYTP